MSLPDHVRVLVVGAGPAGLATAVQLARHGVPSLLVEQRHAPSDLPRATVLSLRSMELLRSWGLEEDVVAGAVEVDWHMLECRTLAEAADGQRHPVGYPSRAQSAVLSPSAPECVAQDHLEPVLLRHLRTLAPATVALGTAVTHVATDPQGTTATLRDVRTGAERRVRAEYLVAADGAHSPTRASLGIAMHGPDALLGGVSATITAPLWDVVGAHRHGIYSVTHPGMPGVFLPAGLPDRWIAGVPSQPDGALPAEAEVVRLVRLGAGVADLPVAVGRIGQFSSAAQLATRYRAGRAFLAGDAAHRVTPRGGTGLNIAFQDGCDLGWKLAWVLNGWAAETLLDTYEAERRPVAEHNAARSADPQGSLRRPEQELPVDIGGRLAHVWERSRVSTLDLLGPGLTLFTGRDGRRWGAAAAQLRTALPLAVRRLSPTTARAVGIIGDGGALLARPDGTPAGVLAAGATAPALRAAVASVAGV
ncbi:MAG TPA: FAD-dependent monooxygenase [Solirubrobacteraceae bacterium]|nr:FAD-dependent monooxygenase [Solirubrobacteraceae bacterium]